MNYQLLRPTSLGLLQVERRLSYVFYVDIEILVIFVVGLYEQNELEI